MRFNLSGRHILGWASLLTVLLVPTQGLDLSGAAQEAPCSQTVHTSARLQRAIDQVEAGAVLCLPAGRWLENLKIEKPLTLRGQGSEASLIQGRARKLPAIWVTGAFDGTVRLENLEVRGPRLGMQCEVPGRYGICAVNILVMQSARLSLEEVKLDGNYTVFTGLDLQGQAQVDVRSSTITRANWWGIQAEQTSRLQLIDSVVSENETGIGASDSASIDVIRSTITQNQHSLLQTGVWVDDSVQLGITESTISENGKTAVVIADAARVTLERNRITDNGWYGVYVYVTECSTKGREYEFTGRILGRENEIHSNGRGNFCPSELRFLTSPEGGEYP